MNELTASPRNVVVVRMHQIAGFMDRFGGLYFWLAIGYFRMGYEFAHLPSGQQQTLWSAFQNAGPFIGLAMLATLNSLRPRRNSVEAGDK